MIWIVLFCLCFWRLDGVFGVEEESVLVMVGDSVALDSDLTEIKDDDLIQWRFGNTVIAEINKRADRFTVDDDVLDGKFRDRLKLNKQTGSLTIIDITAEQIGSYKLEINSVRKRKINVSFYGLRSVSLRKGDSVTLNSGLTEIKDDDWIQWRFVPQNTVIAEISKRADRFTVYDDDLDGRFRDRLKLDNQTGSLTITNIRTEHAGLYDRNINYKITEFFLTVFDEISVTEGDSFTLNSGLTEIKEDAVIQLSFGPENTLIAKINKWLDRFTVYDDVLDGRFRDRLKLDNQTGSLTITNIRTEHEGDYKLQMRVSFRFSLKAFRVSVTRLPTPVISTDCPSSSPSPSSGSHPNPFINQTRDLDIPQLCHTCSDSVHCCGSTEAVIRLVLSALVGVATVILLVYDIRSRRAERDQAHIPTSGGSFRP